jgi:hypothetical protein
MSTYNLDHLKNKKLLQRNKTRRHVEGKDLELQLRVLSTFFADE